jgi:hypothetical protein
MRINPLRAAARTAAAGGVVALGLGGMQAAALASPAKVVRVPCNVSRLTTAITRASSGETIILAPGCVYNLAGTLPNITVSLTIVGHHSVLQRSYARATPDFTILTVTSAGSLTTANVTFYNGGGSTDLHGGAIGNDGGRLTVRGGTFRGNYSGEYGGAIDNSSGTLRVTGATFSNNDSEYGAAIYSEASAAIIGARFSHNAASITGGAIASSTKAAISHSDFVSNSAEDFGGAVFGSSVTVNGSAFRLNRALSGGAIYGDLSLTVTGSEFAGNKASISGGAIDAENTSAVTGSDFRRNVSASGAGIYATGSSLSVRHSDLEFNRASVRGGGIYDEKAAVSVGYSTIDRNSARGGGGIYNQSGTVTLTRTRIYGNRPDNCEPLGTIGGCIR